MKYLIVHIYRLEKFGFVTLALKINESDINKHLYNHIGENVKAIPKYVGNDIISNLFGMDWSNFNRYFLRNSVFIKRLKARTPIL